MDFMLLDTVLQAIADRQVEMLLQRGLRPAPEDVPATLQV